MIENVIFLADFPPIIGGPQVWYFRVCELLLKKNYNLYTLGGKGKPPKGVKMLSPKSSKFKAFRIMKYLIDCITESRIQGKEIIKLLKGRLIKINDLPRVFSYLVLIKRTIDSIPKEKGAVFVSHANYNSLLGYLLCKRHGNLKLVIRCHGGGVEVFSKKRYRLVKFLLDNSDYVNCVSEYIATKAINLGADPTKIQVILSARDIPNQFEFNQKENIILFCGYMEIWKDPFTFLKIVKELEDNELQNHELEYVMIGDGTLTSEVRDKSDELNIGSKVKILGWQKQEEVWKWLRLSKILVLPSTREASGAVLTEAMSLGCYTIATAIGGIPEIINEERGYLFKPGDYKGAVKGIVEYFDNEDESREKVLKAYKYVNQNYSIVKASEQVDNIISRL